uniref:Uncharacterized protein n=1 Tax=Hyaloperonospora arabidopsidis (strain Emoy2) TaxID=559515 RepID=M4B653_HYAAE
MRKVVCRTFKSYLSVCLCVCVSVCLECDHISKCWTLISTGRSRCPTLLYWVNTDINSIILILQCLRFIVFCNLIQFYELNYLYQGASSRACSPILF